ncbi:MAG: hypothetical protein ACJA01_002613 [Saprospiraceae bacterium]|jgi:hypothetical protein
MTISTSISISQSIIGIIDESESVSGRQKYHLMALSCVKFNNMVAFLRRSIRGFQNLTSMTNHTSPPTRAQISRGAIKRMHIEMRHLIIRGGYKPMGRSGEAMIESLLSINPEIYGSIADPERVELTGLLYVFQRLPQAIEECRYIKLITREGFEDSSFTPIIPSKRRRNCYRIDEEQMFIEMTRGQSDVYDVLTHLTFMYNEAEKIARNALSGRNQPSRTWKMIKKIVAAKDHEEKMDRQVAISYLSTLFGRTFEETSKACQDFEGSEDVNDLFSICYWLGKLALQEILESNDREIFFSTALREMLGHHTYGERWANHIKKYMMDKDLLHKPIHIISSNMHSVMNSLYAKKVLEAKFKKHSIIEIAHELSKSANKALSKKVKKYASEHGMSNLYDDSGTNISVQIIDLSKVDPKSLAILGDKKDIKSDDIIIVMDYAFGKQAYETMDELLKPYESQSKRIKLDIRSVNIMGKAGILCGEKGDIMIPTAHIFEGSTDNYPFENALCGGPFSEMDIPIFEGPMITVLGTSLQNQDVLQYFLKSSWGAIGLEMEGAHYQKAIQVASKIRKSISSDVTLRYAYYASDNPLKTGSTLASGSLGLDGVKPTYAITLAIIKGILNQD